jgi:hypothetical protein
MAGEKNFRRQVHQNLVGDRRIQVWVADIQHDKHTAWGLNLEILPGTTKIAIVPGLTPPAPSAASAHA